MDDFGEKRTLCPFRYPDPGPSYPLSGYYTDYAMPIPVRILYDFE
jgi:hypothetical protein